MTAEKTKTGLVLEGGAMRGLFSAGIMDVLMESGVSFDGVIGVSAGAAFGCNWKSHQKGRALRYNQRFCREKLHHIKIKFQRRFYIARVSTSRNHRNTLVHTVLYNFRIKTRADNKLCTGCHCPVNLLGL